jgi:hypothetical protein
MFNSTPWPMDRSILEALLTCNMPMQKTMSFLLCHQGELGLANPSGFIGVSIGTNVTEVCVVSLLSLLQPVCTSVWCCDDSLLKFRQLVYFHGFNFEANFYINLILFISRIFF